MAVESYLLAYIADRPELQTDRSFEPTTIALLLRVHFPIIESEHWGSHAKEA